MKKKLIIAAIVACAITGGIVLVLNSGCKGDTCEAQVSTKSETSIAEQVGTDLQNGALLIDVRTPEEYALEYAENAINLPLADIQSGIYPNVSKDTLLYLYCSSGNRAEQAKTILENAGFTNVTNIGGLTDWQSQGGQVIR